MEVIRIGEEPAWKAGGGSDAACGFEPHGFRLRGHGPTGKHWVRNPEIRVRLSVTPLENAVPWSNGNDTWPTTRKRWFDSIRDHSVLVEQPGVLACLSRRRSRVQIPSRALNVAFRGAKGSDGAVRKRGKAAKLKPW